MHDPNNDVLYVSNQRFSGEGSISKLSIDGNTLAETWVTGLQEPKGMVLDGDRLFVADIDRLRVIDTQSATIVASITGDAKVAFLNDVAQDDEGVIYVAEMFNSAIYKLTRGEERLQRLVLSPDLENPNGLLVEANRLALASWGRFSDGKPMGAEKGRLNFLDLSTMSVVEGSNVAIGQMDGIQRLPATGGYLLTDYVAGNVYHVDRFGTVELMIRTPPNAGDILFLEDMDLLLVPLNDKVVGYKLTCE